MNYRDNLVDRPDWQAVRRIINAVALVACAQRVQEIHEKRRKVSSWRTWL